MVQVEFTLQRFPATGPLKDACGIPLSCVVQPYGAAALAPTPPTMLSALARCQHCYAYINNLCELSDSSFKCSLCSRSTELKQLTLWHNQYCRYPAARQHLPELQQQVYEVIVDPELSTGGLLTQQQQLYYQQQVSSSGQVDHMGQPSVVPVTMFLLDLSGPAEFLELVRSGITVALEALHPDSMVGMIGVSDCITLLDMAGSGPPLLHQLPVLDAAPVLVPLADVMPLQSLLITVAQAKQNMAQALDLLLPDTTAVHTPTNPQVAMSLQQPGMNRRPTATPSPTAAAAATSPAAAAGSERAVGTGGGSSTGVQYQQQQGGGFSSNGRSPPCRAVGPALQAVIEYLKSLQTTFTEAATPTAAGQQHTAIPPAGAAAGHLSGVAQLVLFLSGPPDMAYGKTVAAAAAAGGRGVGAGLEGTISPDIRDTHRQMQDLQLHYPVQDPKSKAFYEQAAVAAASMGVVVDVYAAARGFVGLQTLEPLVNSTGGALYMYPSATEATLAQDLYRRLSAPKALSGVLRLRTSPDIRIIRSYGRLHQDQQYGDMYNIPCSDNGQAFVFDFEHLGAGSYTDQGRNVTLQIAFQYSQVVNVQRAAADGLSEMSSNGVVVKQQPGESSNDTAAAGGGGGSSVGSVSMQGGNQRCFILQRRLRVATLRLPVAVSPDEVYSSVDADTVLTVLTHKITKAVRTQSVSEARLLLRDWLVIFTTNYHRNSYMRATEQQLIQLPVDLTFATCPALRPLPRLVYALLRSPLLSSAAQYHSDLTAYLHHLWCCLPPRELAAAVYPRLRAFADPDTLIAEDLPLSRDSLQGPLLAEAAAQQAAAATTAPKTTDSAGADAAAGQQRANILLLDAFILVLVIYRSGSPIDMAYPPPQHSKLWQTVNTIKRERRVTTNVEVVREGDEGANFFYSLLIDDPDELAETPIPPVDQQQHTAAGGSSGGASAGQSAAVGASPTGVKQFIQHIRAEVTAQLQPHQ